MKNTYNLILFFLLLVASCNSQTSTGLEELKNNIHKIILDKGYNMNLSPETSMKKMSIYGLYNEIEQKENLKNGIYGVSFGSHLMSHFFIYNNGRITFLDLSTLRELQESIKKLFDYSIEHKYCYDLVEDYLSRFINVHYLINRNLRKRIDTNCEKENISENSIYKVEDVKLRLAEFLRDEGYIKSVKYYQNNPEILLLAKTGIYYGLPEDYENIDSGIYYFTYLNKSEIEKNYLLIREGNIEILSRKENSINDLINKILIFADENGYCHQKINIILEQIIDDYFLNDCSEYIKIKLP